MERDGGDAPILRDIRELAESNRVPLNVVGRGRFAAQARSEAPQGVLALAAPLPEADLLTALNAIPARMEALLQVSLPANAVPIARSRGARLRNLR